MTQRRVLQEFIMDPGTGKAVEVPKGQILRIAQPEGGQWADFNCFNLHDYKEFFHTGRTRHMHGLHPTTGDLGENDGDALRYILFSRWIENFMQGPKHVVDLKA